MLLKKLIHMTTLSYSSFSWRQLYNKLLPLSCVLCGFATNTPCHICIKCRRELPILPHCCQQCGLFLPMLPNISLKCGACLARSPSFNLTYALFPYEPPIIQLITKLKFQQQLYYAKALGELLAEQIEMVWYANKPLPDLIIPVPLHPHRLRERGFNQTLEIIRPAAKKYRLPIDIHGIKRIKHTKAQSGLAASERKRNMTNAFQASRDYTNLTIAVIDDVITTGCTITEFCNILKQQGAKHIDVWCCARRG
ncbi:MAG: ComF family protein [Gammaproteobacteria bacterium]|nr:ComF family protein [Gammaproteobacteria bacterium]MCW5583299.1 ComF family protein [Gammaproteobacteria bacterium]